jgi:hypothetical protein
VARSSFTRTAFAFAILALAAVAAAPAQAGPKKYFLTVDGFPGNAALDACGKGYHMAALWEILDVTQLKYDAKRGQVREDSGSGPPAELGGWVRTGGVSGAANNVGVANCFAWSSNLAEDYGSAVELNGNWESPAVFVSPWAPFTATCDSVIPVWCKQN